MFASLRCAAPAPNASCNARSDGVSQSQHDGLAGEVDAPSSTDATSAAVTFVDQSDPHGAGAPDNVGDLASFQAEVIGGGAKLGSTSFHDVEEPNVTRLQRCAGSRQRRAAASQEHDEDLPLDDYEARLLGLQSWGRG